MSDRLTLSEVNEKMRQFRAWLCVAVGAGAGMALGSHYWYWPVIIAAVALIGLFAGWYLRRDLIRRRNELIRRALARRKLA